MERERERVRDQRMQGLHRREGQEGGEHAIPVICWGLSPSTDHCTLHLFPAGPATQRQVQNGPSPEEMDIQRR